MSPGPVGVIEWPEGTAALDLRALVQTVIPVVVEVGGRRFRLTDWDAQYGMFTAVRLPDREADDG